jgi:GTP-binding protein
VPLPRVVIVGRPNVGKSSLLNRIAGRRVSIVEPTAGVTRDRVSVEVEAAGRTFELVDTGGLGLVDEALLKEHIEAQIEAALAAADVVLFVVDGKEGPVPGDQMVADRLRRLSKPTLLVANKVESRRDEQSLHECLRLGFGEAIPVSAVEGFGVTDLLDRVAAELPPAAPTAEAEADVLRFAIVGKRNAGKSTLVNLLVREERVIVSDVPGTTRDAVDVAFEHGGRRLVAIDTAGMRKKSSVQDAIELFSHARSEAAVRRADVVILMFDVREPISQVDKKLAAFIVDNARPVLIVGNKIDLADRVQLDRWDRYIKQQLPGIDHAPVSFVSAKEGINVDATIDLLFDLREQARLRIGTGELNRVLQDAQRKLQPRSTKVPKLFYGTQIGVQPIRIVVFVNDASLFRGQYSRYIENRLREAFDCKEVPIRISFRRKPKVELSRE